MIGLEQAGIAETMDYMFKKFTLEDQNRLAQYVFLTGSNANFPNLLERISKELLEMRPFQSTFNVFKAGMYCRWGCILAMELVHMCGLDFSYQHYSCIPIELVHEISNNVAF